MGSIYTRKGDHGETGLFGGTRIVKNDIRVECYGTIDEANSNIGLAYSIIDDTEIRQILRHIQRRLFHLGAELASDEKGLSLLNDRISEEDVTYLERNIDKYQEIVGPQKGFIIPGNTTASSVLHIARTVVRRAERILVSILGEENVSDSLMKFINRLSDTLFILARYEEQYSFIKEVTKKVIERLNGGNYGNPVTLNIAKKLAGAAEKKACELGIPVVISVVDTGGNLILLHRMNDSLLASIDISINKAYTALSLKMPTNKLTPLLQPGASLYGIQNTNSNRIVAFGGGYPIESNGSIIGGIGVSGGTVDQDMEIVLYSLQVIQ